MEAGWTSRSEVWSLQTGTTRRLAHRSLIDRASMMQAGSCLASHGQRIAVANVAPRRRERFGAARRTECRSR